MQEKPIRTESGTPKAFSPPVSKKGLGRAGWVAMVALALILAGAVLYAVDTSEQLGPVPMSLSGWLFLSLGVLLTLAVGIGLMALMFYSSRHNFDR
ncbi:ABC-type multidrug transport system permease subunit [Rhizomicrobium palustre]|uniref:ABC-type multidrug transport system permease subunit n=1 Tax=Rhizomicrobium palustre TaxID=189966 RepID=A0A846MZF8_9PROT|nr:hypothetical protein [Rhizomicrobium palustre]NIK89008.1 ABC-type multidrug transport system permease subunit [Rhizomicrobium palustre]